MGKSFTGSINIDQFKKSSMYLRAGLAYFEPETDIELKSGDGLEEFIFAVYEIEKKKSGVDYLSLDDCDEHEHEINSFGDIDELHKFNKFKRSS